MGSRVNLPLLAVLSSLVLMSCESTTNTSYSPTVLAPDGNIYGVLKPLDTKYYASDEPVKQAVRHFYEGDFGLAQKYFQVAVERTRLGSSSRRTRSSRTTR
jgi:hypothetical protein